MAFRRMAVRGLAVALLVGGLAGVSQAQAHGGLARPGDDRGPAPARRDAGPGPRPRPRAPARAPRGAPAGRSSAAEGEARRRWPAIRAWWASGPTRYHIDVTGIHAILLPTGKVLFFSYGTHREHQHRDALGPGHPHRQEHRDPEGEHLVRRPDAAGRRPRAGGGRQHPQGHQRPLPRPRLDLDLRPLDRELDLPGGDERRALVPHHHPAPRRAGASSPAASPPTARGSSTPTSTCSPPRPTAPSPARSRPSVSASSTSTRASSSSGRTDAGRRPFRGDAGLLNPATWSWDPGMPQLLGDHYYGSAVLLPDGPSGSSRVMVIGGDQQGAPR